jgi:hypothetical protein
MLYTSPIAQGESMNVTVELERNEQLTVRQWEQFLLQARRAGADDETPVNEHMHEGTDVVVSYQIKVTESRATAPEHVVVPTWLIHDLLSVVTIVAEGDGDVRGLESGAQKARQATYDYLLEPVLGENPYTSEDESESATSIDT